MMILVGDEGFSTLNHRLGVAGTHLVRRRPRHTQTIPNFGCVRQILSGWRGLRTLNRKSVEERGPFVADGPRAIIRFGARRTRYVADLRQTVWGRLGLKYNLRGQIGCRCWCDGMMGGDYLRRDGLQRCFPKEQQRNQRQTYKCQKGQSWHCLSHSLKEGP